MKNLPLLVGTIIASVLLVVAISVGLSSKTEEDLASESINPQVVLGDANNSQGNSESDVKVVAFSDFQCPACKSTEPLVQQILQKYGDKIQYVYRHMPLDSIHPNARLAAAAAEAAANQDAFWPMHAKLFEMQESWAAVASKDALTDTFAGYAQELNLNVEQFRTDIDSDEVSDRVQQDVTAAVASGVTGTPTFYVNGKKTAAQQLDATVQSLVSD